MFRNRTAVILAQRPGVETADPYRWDQPRGGVAILKYAQYIGEGVTRGLRQRGPPEPYNSFRELGRNRPRPLPREFSKPAFTFTLTLSFPFLPRSQRAYRWEASGDLYRRIGPTEKLISPWQLASLSGIKAPPPPTRVYRPGHVYRRYPAFRDEQVSSRIARSVREPSIRLRK